MPTIINKTNNTGFIHIPRTSGFTYNKYLLKNDENNENYFIQKTVVVIIEDAIPNYHYPSYQFENNYQFTSIVRNPYDRFVSCYIKACIIKNHLYSDIDNIPNIERLNYDIDNNFLNLDETFDIDSKANNDFIIFFKTMTYFTHSEDKTKQIVANILRYEELKKDNYYQINIERKNSKYPKFELNEKAINFVNQLYDIDFKNFNYEKIII
jgi:hypothetical protein